MIENFDYIISIQKIFFEIWNAKKSQSIIFEKNKFESENFSFSNLEETQIKLFNIPYSILEINSVLNNKQTFILNPISEILEKIELLSKFKYRYMNSFKETVVFKNLIFDYENRGKTILFFLQIMKKMFIFHLTIRRHLLNFSSNL